MGNEKIKRQLQEIYKRLFAAYGPQHWWPADEPFEVMVGAVLTQSVAWRNVEKAIGNLKKAGLLSPEAMRRLSPAEIAGCIHPTVYYNVKARKLKALVDWFGECCGDSIEKMRAIDTMDLREKLLSVWGIGEETADSIVLYAAGKPLFVIDAYTRRIIDRIGIAVKGKDYSAYQSLFTENLPADAALFNEYHALLVCLGKNLCRSRNPLCGGCPLLDMCRHGRVKDKE